MDGKVNPPEGARGKVFDSVVSVDASPDIVLKASDGDHAAVTPMIVEVNYKPARSKKPKREDLNQAITYGVGYKADQVIIAQPRSRDLLFRSGLSRLGTIGRVEVSRYVFDLGATDLEAEEDRWSGEIRRLLPPQILQS